MRWRLRGLERGLRAMRRHPEWLRYGNLGLAFLLELAALISFGAAGLLLEGWMQLVGIVVGAGVFVGLWAVYAAPRSKRRLKGSNLLLFKIAIFAVAVIILVLIRQPAWAALIAVGATANLFIASSLRQH